MKVNRCKVQEPSPPIAWMICQIRTPYKAPGTGSLTRYAFLVDTMRIISMWISAVFSLHAFFIFWPVLLLPLAINLILFDSQYLLNSRGLHKSCTMPFYGRFGSWGLKFIFDGRVNQLTHSEHEYLPRLSSVSSVPLSHYVCGHAIIWLLKIPS